MNIVSDLAFFVLLARQPSLAAAAQEMGITPPNVSRRLAALERRLGLRLLNRTTRRLSLTAEGQRYLDEGERILQDLEGLEQALTASRETPRGLLRVNATLGFGRSHMGPLISRFVQQYPQVDVQLQLSVNPPPLSDDGFDVCIRFGQPPFRTDPPLAAEHYERPKPGRLVLFPSYMWHGTVPFTTDEKRMTIAFDILPA